jgi:redox-sensitive bicupin YhaK (pirin superfamily)
MLELVHVGRQYSAGLVKSTLAAPVGEEGRPRAVGPFAVLAHALPWESAPGDLSPDVDVRPHPHIGLAAITYVLDGSVTHRDSLGSRQEVTAGGLNFMIAGRGVVHSERFDRVRTLGGKIQLLQVLMALPDGFEDMDPSFVHVVAERIRQTETSGATVRVLAGATDGEQALLGFPVPVFLHDVRLEPGARYRPPDAFGERALYLLSGAIDVGGQRIDAARTAVLSAGNAVATAVERARLLAFGGEAVGPRYMWWNYIHSSLERIESARAQWRAGSVPLPPGDTESFAPAPPDQGRPLHRLNARK